MTAGRFAIANLAIVAAMLGTVPLVAHPTRSRAIALTVVEPPPGTALTPNDVGLRPAWSAGRA